MSGDSVLLFEKKVAALNWQVDMVGSELAAFRSLLNAKRFELRRAVSGPVTNPVTNDAAGEWEEEEKEDRPTLQEELTKTNEHLQRTLQENMELHNRLQTMKEHVDRLQKQLAALEEKFKAEEKISAVFTKSAGQERTRLIAERDNLRQEVHNLQHSLAVERRRLESLDVDGAEQPETEVEKLAREIYLYNTYSATDVFEYAEEFIAERDRRRRESGK